MNIYFGIKYVDDFSNRHVIESLLSAGAATWASSELYCPRCGGMERQSFSPAELMQKTFEIMDSG
ncbi:hypothetical protein ABEX25_05210 [Paenibacillus thiaminolyticus]|uniref:hypothetical protein n=1 Tax=Paenibacillus thiaminolyticus TaxID=49283 RepID=UPI003D274844